MKEYYIVKSHSGCLGAIGKLERLKGRYTNKKNVNKEVNRLNKLRNNNNTIYWSDFLWGIK